MEAGFRGFDPVSPCSTNTSNEELQDRHELRLFLKLSSAPSAFTFISYQRKCPQLGRSSHDLKQRPAGYQHLEMARRKPLVIKDIALQSLPGRGNDIRQ